MSRSVRRSLAGVALAWDGAALAAPSVVGVLTGHRLGAREAVAVELAGSGARIVGLAGGDPGRLETYRRVLGRGDDAYVAFYGFGLLLGVLLLGGRARGAAVAAVLGAASADLIENRALERALRQPLDKPGDPAGADPDAARARRAAGIKFGLLVPAVAMSLAGAVRESRHVMPAR
ncbi:MAG: hypothetical protein WCF04_03230 [Candidatus Nanopelagicales bacterium]